MDLDELDNLQDDEDSCTAIIVGDPHFKLKYLREGEQLIDRVIEVANQKKPNFIVLLGDILDTHEVVHVSPYRLATAFIDELSEITKTFVLIGNHDLIDHKQFLSDQHAFNSFKKWENVSIVDEPIYVVIEGIKFMFSPYVPPGRFIEGLERENKDWQKVDYIFAHQEFRGCKMLNFKSVNGDLWCQDYPIVVSGHIHGAQEMKDVGVYYPGTPFQQNFGEDEEKYIWFATFKKNKNFEYEKINLKIRGKKNIHLTLDKLDNFDYKKEMKNNSIKFHLSGTREEFKEFRKSKKYKELKKEGVMISFCNTAETPIQTKHDTFENILNDLLQQSTQDVRDLYFELLKN